MKAAPVTRRSQHTAQGVCTLFPDTRARLPRMHLSPTPGNRETLSGWRCVRASGDLTASLLLRREGSSHTRRRHCGSASEGHTRGTPRGTSLAQGTHSGSRAPPNSRQPPVVPRFWASPVLVSETLWLVFHLLNRWRDCTFVPGVGLTPCSPIHSCIHTHKTHSGT